MESSNKRIVKNTVYLYMRMFVTVLVTLYTSRVVLSVLGVSDYGLYNVVGGTLTFFSFINSAMSGCTQRYLNIALGKGEKAYTEKVFSVSLTIHICMAVLFFGVMLFVGLFIVNNQLVIEPERLDAARWVLIISLLSVCISFITVPCDAAIIAHEKMDFYAVISMAEVFAKLGITYLLTASLIIDRLIFYALLLLTIQILLSTSYSVYCYKHFEECKPKLRIDKSLIVEMSHFVGWSLFGNLSFVLSTQGINIVLNLFFGTVANAAWGVASQVKGAFTKFSSSFQIASSPQIMKLYATGNDEGMFNLTKNVSKFSVFLILIIGIPLFLEIDYILSLWLVDVPDNAALFVRIMILQITIGASSFPVSRSIVATGKIKESCIMGLVIEALFVVVFFLVLKVVGNLTLAISLLSLPPVISHIYLLYLLHKLTGATVKEYVPDVFIKIFMVIIAAGLLPICLHFLLDEGIMRLILVLVINTIMLLISVFYLGMDSQTRTLVVEKINKYIKK